MLWFLESLRFSSSKTFFASNSKPLLFAKLESDDLWVFIEDV